MTDNLPPLPEFEKWLRSVCFQAPPAHAYDLARCAWIEAGRAALAQAQSCVPAGVVLLDRKLAENCLAGMKYADHWERDRDGRPPSQVCCFEIRDLEVALAAPQPQPIQPTKRWHEAEIDDGNRGIRWVTDEGVHGRPTAHDVREYVLTNWGTVMCTCDACSEFFKVAQAKPEQSPHPDDDAAESMNETNAVLARRYFDLLKVVEDYEKHGVTCQTFRNFVDVPWAECNSAKPERAAKPTEKRRH